MRAFWAVAGLGLVFVLPVWAGSATNTVPAMWKEQRLNFFYAGRTSRYSCEGLRDKMRSLLLILGARRDLKVSVMACNESAPQWGLGSLGPSLSLVYSSPVMIDANAKPLHPGDLAAVDARYEAFTLTSDAFRNFGLGDCELVEEFARLILPNFATRDLRQDITCVPYQLTGSRFLVRGESLRDATRP
jgi:hypothetical protein